MSGSYPLAFFFFFLHALCVTAATFVRDAIAFLCNQIGFGGFQRWKQKKKTKQNKTKTDGNSDSRARVSFPVNPLIEPTTKTPVFT